MVGVRKSDPHSILKTGFDHIETCTIRRRADFTTNEQDWRFEALQFCACHGTVLLLFHALDGPGVVSGHLALGFCTLIPRTRADRPISENFQPAIDVALLKSVQNRFDPIGSSGFSGLD